jgi:arabinofuranan 3-O-arabinosyltransferase
VSLSFDTFTGAPVTSVRITTEDRSVVADVGPDGTAPLIDVDDDSATRMRVTVLGVGDGARQVRLSDVRIADHDVARSLVLPGGVSAATSVYLTSEAPQRACAIGADDRYVGCELTRQVETSETSGFDRTITVEEGGEWRLMGRVVATHGPAVERLFAPLSDELVGVTASTTYAGDPAVTAAGAVDGRPETGWTSAPGDAAPALQLTWGPRRKVTGVVVTSSPGQPGELPDALVVDGGPRTGEPQLVATSGPEAGEMRPVRTDQLRVTALGQAGLNGVGVAELEVAGIEDLWHRPDADTPTGATCGFGPTIELGGRVVQTRVSGTLRDVRSGADLAVVPCGKRSVELSPGTHRVRVVNPAGFATTSLVLTPSSLPEQASASPPAVQSWSATHRKVEVSVGSESVLGVRESYNRGWEASIDGVDLRPVVLDGWRQGFVLPAGTSGVVELDYGPQAPFRAALQGGLVLVGLLLLLAVLLLVRSAGRSAAMPTGDASVATVGDSRRSTRVKQLAQLPAVLVLGLVSLPLAVGALVAWATRHRSIAEVSAACAGALAFAGVMALSASAVVVPPVGSDVVVALVVGVVCGRVLVRP